MGFFEKLRGAGDNSQKESDTSEQAPKKGAGTLVTPESMRKPISSDPAALAKEAPELFTRKKRETLPREASPLSEADKEALRIQAERDELSKVEKIMTGARTQILDILARIEAASKTPEGVGLALSPEERNITLELATKLAEAARIEFREAERTNPILALNRILEKLFKQSFGAANDRLFACARDLNDNIDQFFRDFRKKQQELIQRGDPEPANKEVVEAILSENLNQQRPIAALQLFGRNSEYRAVTEQLLAGLSVYSGGKPLPLDDLFAAIRATGRTGPGDDNLPYSAFDENLIAGLRSTLTELNGLSVNVQLRSGNDPQTITRLRGDALFWLRVVENAQTLEKK